MPYEVGGFGPQMWNIALNLGHWDTLSWTKPLPIRYTFSQICKLCSPLREKQTIGMRKTDAHVKRGCSWSRQKYKALICSKSRAAPFQDGFRATKRARSSDSRFVASSKNVSFCGLNI